MAQPDQWKFYWNFDINGWWMNSKQVQIFYVGNKYLTSNICLVSGYDIGMQVRDNDSDQSLLEYKTMNMKLDNCVCVVQPNTILLWRNYGFLHSFCNFSKSNAFGENFMITEFILHKIFFRMSTLLQKNLVDVLQFILKKIAKNHLCEDVTVLRERGCLVTKININFFVRNEVFNIFHVTI